MDPTTTILDLSSIRTFKLKNQVLAYKDAIDHAIFAPDAQWVAENPVIVVDDDTEPRELGTAVVSDVGDKIVADFFLDRECPQRLEIETKSRNLYPIAFFEALEFNKEGVVIKVQLTRIEIRPDDNPFDDRIQPLSETL